MRPDDFLFLLLQYCNRIRSNKLRSLLFITVLGFAVMQGCMSLIAVYFYIPCVYAIAYLTTTNPLFSRLQLLKKANKLLKSI